MRASPKHISFSCELLYKNVVHMYIYFQDLEVLVEEEKKRMRKEAEEINKKN